MFERGYCWGWKWSYSVIYDHSATFLNCNYIDCISSCTCAWQKSESNGLVIGIYQPSNELLADILQVIWLLSFYGGNKTTTSVLCKMVLKVLLSLNPVVEHYINSSTVQINSFEVIVLWVYPVDAALYLTIYIFEAFISSYICKEHLNFILKWAYKM